MRQFNPSGLIRSIHTTSGLLIDTREIRGLPKLIQDLQHRSVPVISIHDLGLAPLGSDIIIDGSLLPGNPRAGANARRYLGPDYLVIDPDPQTRHLHRPAPAAASKVVAGLGGGDVGAAFLRLLEALRRTGRELNILGIPGYFDWGQEALSRRDWSPLRFQWADRQCNTSALMADADLAVTAGGLMAFEALAAGAPLCALAHDRFQATTVQALCRAGGCVNLGRSSAIAPGATAGVLRLVLADRELRHRLSDCGRRILDGRGAERVATLICDAVSSHYGKGLD
jgi:spore coat polysaccharide biosynthesis predicted glycosyltransferase SpsG